MNALKFCTSKSNSLGPCAHFSRWILTNCAGEMYWTYARVSSLSVKSHQAAARRRSQGRRARGFLPNPVAVRPRARKFSAWTNTDYAIRRWPTVSKIELHLSRLIPSSWSSRSNQEWRGKAGGPRTAAFELLRNFQSRGSVDHERSLEITCGELKARMERRPQ